MGSVMRGSLAGPTLAALALQWGLAGSLAGQVRFQDHFDGDLSGWMVSGAHAIEIVETRDPAHGRALELRPDGWDVYVLVRGSERWGGLRIEGQMTFPDEGHSYLGVLYNFGRRGSRADFGNLYIKGNGSYIRVNPHRDGNVGRTLYEEYRTPLTGESAVRVGEWQSFRMEIVGGEAHLYVGESTAPRITFPGLELTSGSIGFQPRCCGSRVWIDDITVSSIEGFEYVGPALPNGDIYEPEALLTDWQVIGPLAASDKAIERSRDGNDHPWRPFPADPRGAVITGSVTDYEGDRTLAYFRTTVRSDGAEERVLSVSSVDHMQIWVNGAFTGYHPRQDYAWFDFWKNPEHQGWRLKIDLEPGENQILIRVRGGEYASGGFFARLEPR